MGILYTTKDSVKVRLAGKIQFQTEAELLDGQMPDALLCQLIEDAETEVEQDLRSRYAIPFRSKKSGTFAALPDHSKRSIRQIVDFKAVEKILATDFGRGTHINAEGYYEKTVKEYELMVNKLLGRDSIGANDKIDRFKYSPPLEDMMLAPHNKEADDGYRGMIINTDASVHDEASYAAQQINDPSKSYIRRRGFGGI